MSKIKEKKVKNDSIVPSFAESISKITVSDDTPPNMLAEWEKEYAIDCRVIPPKPKKEKKGLQ